MPENTITPETTPLRNVGRVRGQDVLTPYTNERALELLANVTGDFPADLIRTHQNRGRLSEAQWCWVHHLVLRREQAQQAAAAAANQPPRYAQIAEMFRHAAAHLQNPRIVIAAGRVNVTLSLAGPRSRVPGSINVTDGGRYPNNVFFGRIHTDGRWEPSQRNASDMATTALDAMEADPATYIGAAGRTMGQCCFCRHTLTDERSLHVGYGPVCADHFHLPWGDRPVGQASGSSEAGAARPPRQRRSRRTAATVAGYPVRQGAAVATLATEVCPCCGENKTPGSDCRNC